MGEPQESWQLIAAEPNNYHHPQTVRAAKRIVELEAENQRLRDEASEAADIGVHLGMHKAGERERVLKDRIEELEAERSTLIDSKRLDRERVEELAVENAHLRHHEQLRQAELAQLREANRWIPVESGELPQPFLQVCAWGVVEGSWVYAKRLRSGDWVWSNGVCTPTHWRRDMEGPGIEGGDRG